MPLLNLSLVTQSLLTVLERSIVTSPEWNVAQTLTPSPQPPDRLAGEHVIGLYLYHIVEDAAYKNAPSPASGTVPLRFTPMGLQLYYVLTAHSDLNGDNATFAEQLLMGLAMKALRDNPMLDDTSTVAGTQVFPAQLRGRDNRFRIALQAIPANEAVQYWTAGSHPLRLCTYYQVSVALLEPEPVTSRTGRVLTYGVHLFLRGAPRLDYSTNHIEFTIPGEAASRTIDLRPAEAALGEILEFHGTELAGDETRLVVWHPTWSEPIEVDSIQWGITASPSQVFARAASFAGSQPVLPGIYLASVRVISRRVMPDGSVRDFVKSSNQTPFAVAPRIDNIAFALGVGTVTGTNFDPSVLTDDSIRIFLAADALTRVNSAPNAGQFRVLNATTFDFRFPATSVTGDVIPFRIIIRGAESAPRWVTVP